MAPTRLTTDKAKRETITLLRETIADLQDRLAHEIARADAERRRAERAEGNLERVRSSTEAVLLWMGDKLKELEAKPNGRLTSRNGQLR